MLKKPKKIPTNPGIYVFSRGPKPLYIGKALNLKNRVSQYFQNSGRLPPKIQKMLGEATSLKFIETASEIEALIKEAELIKKHRPKYNSLMRDDKNYFFVGITKEDFPRIFVTHQPHGALISKPEARKKSQTPMFKAHSGFGFRVSGFRYIGPFTSGGALHTTLKLLRRVFPYCTCKGTHKRPCLNSQIGRCPGHCCTTTEVRNQKSEVRKRRSEYRRNIQSVVAVLMGQKPTLTAELKKRMKIAAKGERYEEAARLRDQIWGLESVFAHRQVLGAPDAKTAWPELMPKLQTLLRTKTSISRIEGYDIANIAGREATGSMVVFFDGQPDKSQYRKFKIKTVRGVGDVDMIKEVLMRRLKHAEWPYPQLIVVDGGKGQLNAALLTLQELRIKNHELRELIVVALVKREEILYLPSRKAVPLKSQPPDVLHLFQRVRDEAHRFARAYHHRLRRRRFSLK